MSKMLDDDFNESDLFNEGAVAPVNTRRAAPVASPPANVNPLGAYFRMPGLSIRLPTNGRFLPPGSLTLDATGQVEVFPMRSGDELLLKSPDALMSGIAIEKMIESCVPAIKTPALVSAPDLDVLLLAIRAATYGNIMSVEVQCPKCDAELAFDCDLSTILATLTTIPDDLDVRLSEEVVVVMRPHTLSSQTKLLLAAYEEQRRAQAINDDNVNQDTKQFLIKQTLDRLSGFQTDSISEAVIKVIIPNQDVVDRKYIREFIENTPKDWSKKIQDRLEEINMMGLNRDVEACCKECKHEWKTKLEFNPATFFEQGSLA